MSGKMSTAFDEAMVSMAAGALYVGADGAESGSRQSEAAGSVLAIVVSTSTIDAVFDGVKRTDAVAACMPGCSHSSVGATVLATVDAAYVEEAVPTAMPSTMP